jgi:FAD:protein FMN transferase
MRIRAAIAARASMYALSRPLPWNDPMMHVSRRAMATQFEIRFPGHMREASGASERDVQLALETLEYLERLEEQLSFFRPASELSRINLLAAEMPVAVEPELFQLLCMAKAIWRETEGAFDATAAPLWQAWGFARRAGAVPSEPQIADALSRVGFQFVELEGRSNTIRFIRPGVQLNLGGIGKGYALERCAARLVSGGMEHFLLHAGQSSIHARGLWTIGIPHPWKTDRRLAEIKLGNRAIGTSSSRFQSFRHEGKRYGHIIDPRTGRPAEGLLSATVLAPSSALADALSTAFFVFGLEKSLAYCQNHPEIGAVLLTSSVRGGGVEVHYSGLDDDNFVLKD